MVLVEDVVWVNRLVSGNGKEKENKSVRFHFNVNSSFLKVMFGFLGNQANSIELEFICLKLRMLN